MNKFYKKDQIMKQKILCKKRNYGRYRQCCNLPPISQLLLAFVDNTNIIARSGVFVAVSLCHNNKCCCDINAPTLTKIFLHEKGLSKFYCSFVSYFVQVPWF